MVAEGVCVVVVQVGVMMDRRGGRWGAVAKVNKNWATNNQCDPKGKLAPPLFERSAEQYTLRCPGNPLVLPSIPQPPL